jgi:hypothetical protein
MTQNAIICIPWTNSFLLESRNRQGTAKLESLKAYCQMLFLPTTYVQGAAAPGQPGIILGFSLS